MARTAHDPTLRQAAKSALRRPPVLFDGQQALAIANGFAKACRDSGYVWAEGCWKRFLNSGDEMMKAIRDVNDNPLKEGKKRQNWHFVVPFPGQV